MRFKSDRQRRAVLAKLNPYRKSSYRALQDKGIRLKPYADTDNDGTPNRSDPQPLNRSVPALQASAARFFRHRGLVDRYHDLSETSDRTLPLTRRNFKRWKQDVAGTDLKGIDTEDQPQAMAIYDKLQGQTYKDHDLVDEYLDADGDFESFKTYDKDYRESIMDEISWELEH